MYGCPLSVGLFMCFPLSLLIARSLARLRSSSDLPSHCSCSFGLCAQRHTHAHVSTHMRPVTRTRDHGVSRMCKERARLWRVCVGMTLCAETKPTGETYEEFEIAYRTQLTHPHI